MPLSLKQAESFPLFSIKAQVYSQEALRQVEKQLLQVHRIKTTTDISSSLVNRQLSN